ncbi:MAG: type VI secretion system tip protein TssI/VgrG [Planctomycetaceae bacterium]
MTVAPVAVASPLGADALDLRRLTGTETLGRPFLFEVELLSDDDHLDLDAVLGMPMSVGIEQHGDTPRYFHGHAVQFEHAGLVGRRSIYRATLRPWLWFLTRTADCRIFQNLTAPEIVEKVFRDLGFSDFESKLTAACQRREYCVQYRETDFQFVSRLMEEEGIYYYFRHEEKKHTMVLADAISGHAEVPGYETVRYREEDAASGRTEETMFQWSVARTVRTGAFALTDYDFEKPNADLAAAGAAGRAHPHADFEVFDYPGRYLKIGDGEAYAKVRLEEEQTGFEQTAGAGNARGLFAGGLFTLEDFPRTDQNREYLIVSAEHDVTVPAGAVASAGGGAVYRGRIKAIPSSQQFRPARETPKAVVKGPQTAVVVGKAGEEIWTDKYGRIKVQFPWDRYGKKDENSSCWVRVAQIWAGKTWGGMEIPRIGQEVMVEFLEGDPDQPIVTGRVYNADQMPPFELPANATQSGLRTRSSKGGDATTFNELRFEDLKGSEQVYFHAEKNFDRVVENNDTLKVGFDKKDKGDQSVEVFNNQTVAVGAQNCADGSQAVTVYNKQTLTVGVQGCADGSQTITVLKDRTESVKNGNESVTIEKGNRTVAVDKGNDVHQVKAGNRTVKVDAGNDEVTVAQGNRTVKVTAGKCTIEAGQSIELKVGGSSIKIEPAKITLKAAQIAIEGSAKTEVKGAMTEVSGSGMLQLKGGLVKIN